MTSLTEIN